MLNLITITSSIYLLSLSYSAQVIYNIIFWQWLYTKITSSIKSRKEKINEAISNYKIFNSNEFLFSEYLSYSKSLLKDNKIYHIADKKLVKTILSDVFSHYNLEINTTIDVYEFFISNITRGEWISEWDNLISVINTV